MTAYATQALEPMEWRETCGPRGQFYTRFMARVRLSNGEVVHTGLRDTAAAATAHARALVASRAAFGPGHAAR